VGALLELYPSSLQKVSDFYLYATDADNLDQSLPNSLASKDPTSAIFDFVFDYNMELIRRDSGPLSMRVDYSNVGGKQNCQLYILTLMTFYQGIGTLS
jgi:hypothetical protein